MVPIWPNSICSLFLLVEREGIVTEVDGAGATAAGTWADSCAGGVSSANEANTGVEFVIIIITVKSKCKFKSNTLPAMQLQRGPRAGAAAPFLVRPNQIVSVCSEKNFQGNPRDFSVL